MPDPDDWDGAGPLNVGFYQIIRMIAWEESINVSRRESFRLCRGRQLIKNFNKPAEHIKIIAAEDNNNKCLTYTYMN